MEDDLREFLAVEELSRYLGIKKSNLYSKVERKEIPHYRVGRLILFKKDEIDAFMAVRRVDVVDIKKKTKGVLDGVKRAKGNVDGILKKAIEEVKGSRYNPTHGKPDRIKGLRKEVSHGSL